MNREQREIRDVQIAVQKASGSSDREIGRKWGMTRQGINEIVNRGDVKALIKEITNKMALKEGVKAYENISYCIDVYRKKKIDDMPKEKALQMRDHGFKASVKVLESLGIFESAKTSVNVQNITNTQNNIVSPMMADLIKKHLGITDATDI